MTKMSDSVECPKCGESFPSEKSMVSHHSAKCDDSHSGSIKRVDTNCENCDSKVSYLPNQSNSELHFCDGSCRSRYFGEQMENKLVRDCKNCGQKFEYCPSDERKYCSKSCYDNGGRTGRTANRKRISCQYCGDEFSRAVSKIQQSNKNFCSESCRDSWVSETFTQENHPRWVDNDDKRYGPNWSNVRETCIERDFGRCRSCRMDRDKHKKKFGTDIHVHHKTPLRTFDGPEKANKLSNLITLCVVCHRTIESEIIS